MQALSPTTLLMFPGLCVLQLFPQGKGSGQKIMPGSGGVGLQIPWEGDCSQPTGLMLCSPGPTKAAIRSSYCHLSKPRQQIVMITDSDEKLFKILLHNLLESMFVVECFQKNSALADVRLYRESRYQRSLNVSI